MRARGAGYAAAARERKAARIAEVVWEGLSPEQRLDPEMPARLARMPQEGRDLAAEAASTKAHRHGPPSEQTWDMVVGAIARRMSRERERRDPFARFERRAR